MHNNPLLCRHVLPGSRLCSQPHLRGESFCRFHIRNHAEDDHDERIYRLNEQLDAMELPQLLETLRKKLEKIRCYLRPYPEAIAALRAAIDRLSWLNQMESMTPPQTPPNQGMDDIYREMNELLESLKE